MLLTRLGKVVSTHFITISTADTNTEIWVPRAMASQIAEELGVGRDLAPLFDVCKYRHTYSNLRAFCCLSCATPYRSYEVFISHRNSKHGDAVGYHCPCGQVAFEVEVYNEHVESCEVFTQIRDHIQQDG